MNPFTVVKAFIKTRKISSHSREKILELQEKLLRETLFFTYDHSTFYRELWEKNGIKREDLNAASLEQLPIVTKRQLMENFERVVTESDIVKADVEKFIDGDTSGAALYRNSYVVLNTSGSSGYIGIFLFTTSFWDKIIATLVARLINLPLRKLFTRKNRLAFTGEILGHHAGASLVRSAPALFFNTKSLSISEPEEKIIEDMNKFMPHILTGYASALASLAEAQLSGRLRITPEIIISSGEPLTPIRQQRIESAFGKKAADFYGATECLAIGADISGSGFLDIFDGILKLEVVDDNGKLLLPGNLGRVVITVFGNKIQPLIRYALDDEVVLEPESAETPHPFTRAQRVLGRDLERLNLKTSSGALVLHPMEMVGFFFPGLQQYQLQQTGPNSTKLLIVAEGDPGKNRAKVMELYSDFLKEHGVGPSAVDFSIEFVDSIPPDPKTGKTPIIIPLGKK